MLLNVSPLKSAITSIISALAGSFPEYFVIKIGFISLEAANTLFQHAAWTVAILAGIVSIINGVKNWFSKKKYNETDQ